MFFGLFSKEEPKIEETKATSSYNEKASKATPEYVTDYENAGNKPRVEAFYNAYSTSDLVNSCISYISETGGLAKPKVYQKDKTGKAIPLKNKKVRALFEGAPNNFITWQELLEQSIQSYLLTGNTYLSFEALERYELWLLEANKVAVVPDVNEYVKGYIYNDKINFIPTELLHIRRASADNLYYGTSAVMSCIKDSLLLEGYAITDLKQFYENSSVGNGVLSSEFPLTQSQIDSIREQFAENYGNNNGRHSTILLPSKMTYSTIKLSPKDSMLLDSLDISSDRVLRSFRLHKLLLGGQVDSYSNKMADIATLVFNTAIKPITEKVAAQLQLFFRTVLKTDNLYVDMDYDQIPYMNSILENKGDAVAKLTSAGLMSFNEGRDALGLPQIDNANYDVRWLPAYLYSGVPTTIEDYVPGTPLNGTVAPPPTTVDPQGGNNQTVNAN